MSVACESPVDFLAKNRFLVFFDQGEVQVGCFSPVFETRPQSCIGE